VNRFVRGVLRRLPFTSGVMQQLAALQRQVHRQGLYPAGHYHSPIPDPRDLETGLHTAGRTAPEPEGIDLNLSGQARLLDQFEKYYADLPFPQRPAAEFRFHFDNDWFSYPDAIFLYSFMRLHRPARIVEVGSGFSSAVMLDTVDNFFEERPHITFIEPHPERLQSLLSARDHESVQLLSHRVQDVDRTTFGDLAAGDLLFIDSSHVVKCGSDLQFLLFEVLPRLAPGVLVHFHDVFFPFEYPRDWLAQGRYWNEIYFLRAFLSFNSDWEICFFNSYVQHAFSEHLQERMPLCLRNPGGSLYIRRRATPAAGVGRV
jgi:predicted O-methyltransferase YrrM